jgi:hypothetical protein
MKSDLIRQVTFGRSDLIHVGGGLLYLYITMVSFIFVCVNLVDSQSDVRTC